MLDGRRIVVVEDDEIMGASLLHRLELEGADVLWLKLMGRALPAIRSPRKAIDAVVCDIRLPDGTGEELFDTLARTTTPPPFLFITGQGGIDQAVRLMRSGAADYVTKPFDIGLLLRRLARVMRPPSVEPAFTETGIGATARAVDRWAGEAAARETPVLIRAAMGLGKTRLARRIHEMSDRRAAPFVIHDGRLDGDLARDIAAAGEGTLLVRDVDHLSGPAQDRLMPGLREGPFRLMATSAASGPHGVAPLREDLRSALQAHEVAIPPLADRPEDALWLARRLIDRYAGRRSAPVAGIAAPAEEAILAYGWPGNGRELRARILRALEAATGELILTSDLFPEGGAEASFRPLADVRDAAERAQILKALERTGGHVAEAAQLLRISRTTLWEKMQKHGIERFATFGNPNARF